DWRQKGQLSYMADVRRPEVQQGGAKHDPAETPEEFTEVQLRYGQTEEGAKYNRWMFGSGFVIRPDGTFTIEDLVPGKYRIEIRNLESQKGTNFSQDVASGDKEFEIPADSAPNSPPMDVGTVT